MPSHVSSKHRNLDSLANNAVETYRISRVFDLFPLSTKVSEDISTDVFSLEGYPVGILKPLRSYDGQINARSRNVSLVQSLEEPQHNSPSFNVSVPAIKRLR